MTDCAQFALSFPQIGVHGDCCPSDSSDTPSVIRCNADMRITFISLRGMGLQGSVPNLHALTYLETLDLSHNALESASHSPIADLAYLAHCDLSNNHLSGDVLGTFDFISLPRLSTLILTNNSFTSVSSITPLQSLSSLKLGANNLTDLDFVKLSRLPQLQSLDVSENFIAGSLDWVSTLFAPPVFINATSNCLAGKVDEDARPSQLFLPQRAECNGVKIVAVNEPSEHPANLGLIIGLAVSFAIIAILIVGTYIVFRRSIPRERHEVPKTSENSLADDSESRESDQRDEYAMLTFNSDATAVERPKPSMLFSGLAMGERRMRGYGLGGVGSNWRRSRVVSLTGQEPLTPTLWSVEQVMIWLDAMGFSEEVVTVFREKEINGAALINLDSRSLKEWLGIDSFGLRSSLLSAIETLTPGASASRVPHTPTLPPYSTC